MRCDVSFDGNWLVYLALGTRGNTWNAVSELPRLTAVAESKNMGTWYGGGYFRSRDVLCMNRWEPEAKPKLPFRAEQLVPQFGGEDMSVLYRDSSATAGGGAATTGGTRNGKRARRSSPWFARATMAGSASRRPSTRR